MKVTKVGKRYQVRVEELLPCPRFHCIHESMACATRVWCPDGCFDTNTYVGACIPKCIDCVYYPEKCLEWKNFWDAEKHSALSHEQSEVHGVQEVHEEGVALPCNPAPTCPECGSTRVRIVYKDDEATEVNFYDCTLCSAVFLPTKNVPPNRNPIKHIYGEEEDD